MALTPEDVVNKRFQPTKFREGYDQDEVDDFLDEVVVELRRLNQENEELKQRLVASESRIAELQRSGAQAAQAAQAAPEQAAPAAAPVVAAAAAPAVAAYAAPTPVDPNAVDPSSTNNLLQLARRLHEEHVREGVEKRDALIAEGHATAARVVAEAESKQRAQIGQLDQERALLEHRIDELRTFEREYRQQLKSYIEGQLRDLETSSVSGTGSYAAPASANQSSSSGQVPVAASAPASALPSAPSNDGAQESAPQPPTFQGFGG
ncbi:DivIVA domain-containing protein [Diaminobutyricibacter sp. McL0618]|uniref:DivIVA domain-containing protein n=1 Tax=Leifsonia sp. McL0618 TaxID=3415677 RepID=UPI003CEAFDDD